MWRADNEEVDVAPARRRGMWCAMERSLLRVGEEEVRVARRGGGGECDAPGRRS